MDGLGQKTLSLPIGPGLTSTNLHGPWTAEHDMVGQVHGRPSMHGLEVNLAMKCGTWAAEIDLPPSQMRQSIYHVSITKHQTPLPTNRKARGIPSKANHCCLLLVGAWSVISPTGSKSSRICGEDLCRDMRPQELH